MLSLDFVCQHPQMVREALRKRHDTRNVDAILHLAEQRRGLTARSDGLYAVLKKLKAEVRATSEEKRAALNQQIKATTQDIRQLEIKSGVVDNELRILLLNLPNL